MLWALWALLGCGRCNGKAAAAQGLSVITAVRFYHTAPAVFELMQAATRMIKTWSLQGPLVPEHRTGRTAHTSLEAGTQSKQCLLRSLESFCCPVLLLLLLLLIIIMPAPWL